MAKQFLHISFKFSDGGPKINELKPVFDKAIDWFRYASNCGSYGHQAQLTNGMKD
jgi:hypothetical protein